MKYKFILLFTICCIILQAQDSLNPWKKNALIGLNLSQSSYSNWTAGGENSVSATALFSGQINYKKGKSTWDNSLDMAYGKVSQKSFGLRKTDDKIDFSSKYGKYAFYKNWYYSTLINFKTQFDDGYNYPNDSTVISHFMAPGYLLAALGMDYKPVDYFSILISPFTGKVTFVNNQILADQGAFGVTKATYDSLGNRITKGKTVRREFGGYIKIAVKKEIMKNVLVSSKVELFSNYLHHPENVDVNWELLVNLKVNKYISASISTQLVYDDDIIIIRDDNNDGIKEVNGPRTQFKEVLSVGFSYKL